MPAAFWTGPSDPRACVVPLCWGGGLLRDLPFVRSENKGHDAARGGRCAAVCSVHVLVKNWRDADIVPPIFPWRIREILSLFSAAL